MRQDLIGRRGALRYGGLLAGTAAGRAFLFDWLAGQSGAAAPQMSMHHHHGEASVPSAPVFFKPGEFRTLEILTEMIIPSDDQPGAKEAQVARFIDFVVSAATEYEPKLQDDWIKGLTLLDRLSIDKYSHAFQEVSASNREQLLTEMSQPEHQKGATHPGFSFYALVKRMTVDAFYSSRVGLIDVLEYKGLQAIAEFQGCTHPEHQT